MRGPRRPQRVQRTAQELPSGDQSGPRDPPRVPNGPPMVPLGRLWAPFGLPWGGFGELWVTFGDPLDTSGRHCGHFWCKAPELSKTNEFVGNPWLRSTRGRPRCSHFWRSWAKNLPKVDTRAPKRAQRQTKTPKSNSRGLRGGHKGPKTEKERFSRVAGGAKEGGDRPR